MQTVLICRFIKNCHRFVIRFLKSLNTIKNFYLSCLNLVDWVLVMGRLYKGNSETYSKTRHIL